MSLKQRLGEAGSYEDESSGWRTLITVAARCERLRETERARRRVGRTEWAKSSNRLSTASRQAVPARGDLWVGEKRSVEVGARCRRALRRLTRGVWSNAATAGRGVSYAARPRREHRSGVLAAGEDRHSMSPEQVPPVATRSPRAHLQADQTSSVRSRSVRPPARRCSPGRAASCAHAAPGPAATRIRPPA